MKSKLLSTFSMLRFFIVAALTVFVSLAIKQRPQTLQDLFSIT